MAGETAIILTADAALDEVIENWALASTDAGSPRRYDLMRDKTRAVVDFFNFCERRPLDVSPGDVKAWQKALERQGLAPGTVYARVSRLSSFYRWLAALPAFRGRVLNPVDAARPKAPRAYQTDNVKALSADAVRRLLDVVKARAAADLVGKRDFAMLLFYLLTGRRRAEIARLRWEDLDWGPPVTVTYRVKGGRYEQRELGSDAPAEALLDYLEAAGRLEGMQPGSPLWVAHGPATRDAEAPLTSHAFVKNLKAYALQAGVGDVHLHQTRHTAATVIAERQGLKAAQEMLGHRKEETTRIYVSRISAQKDRFSGDLADVFGIEE